jgi:hypothetical protein
MTYWRCPTQLPNPQDLINMVLFAAVGGKKVNMVNCGTLVMSLCRELKDKLMYLADNWLLR